MRLTPGRSRRPRTLREITDEIMAAVRAEVAELRGEPAPAEFFKPAGKTPTDSAERITDDLSRCRHRAVTLDTHGRECVEWH